MKFLIPLAALSVGSGVFADKLEPKAGPITLEAQNAALSKNTDGKGFGPQSPRDLTTRKGKNPRVFVAAPPQSQMNLCNIHFHENAEHKGGEFTKFAGPGDGYGHGTGYQYSGKLSAQEVQPLAEEVCKGEHGSLQAGDTLELHYVFSTAQVAPGPTLAACMNEAGANPQLRVQAQVLVLVNHEGAADFNHLTQVGLVNGYHQPVNIPTHTGKPARYAGSTTGPAYNEKGSPLQVTWAVRPKVVKVNVASVGAWCKSNVFNENHAHGVRNLVVDDRLLSTLNRAN